MTKLPCITLNRHANDRAKRKHPWIFSNEISDPKLFQRIEPGSQVDVLDCKGEYLGTGITNPKSLISVRIFTRTRGEELSEESFLHKITSAVRLREAFYGKNSPSQGTYRAVFGESDGLPGLIIDRFQGGWVIEPHALGMDLRKDLIVNAIRSLSQNYFQEKEANIFYRTDYRAAGMEGIESKSEILSGSHPSTGLWAVEDEIKFGVDPLKGQKTGFFFDQRDNRTYFSQWIKGASRNNKNFTVLDVFCHAGAWGLRALKAGACHATFIDSSAAALEGVKESAKKMGVADKIELIQSDAMEAMKKLSGKKFSAIALDPPALVPNKKSIPAGTKHYKDLNVAAMNLLGDESVLSSSSCSYHMDEARFEETLLRAQVEAGKIGRILNRGGNSADHPMLVGMPEGRYLKNLFISY